MDTDARLRYAWTTAFSHHGAGGGGGDPIGPPIARERAMGSAAGRNGRVSFMRLGVGFAYNLKTHIGRLALLLVRLM